MNVTFIHTADWQLGKPFAGVDSIEKRALLQNERFAALRRIGEAARAHGAGFILVAGDLFDSPCASNATVSAACSAIGGLGLPVYAIPGNHDHGGTGSLWERDYFRREREHLAPNLQVLLKAEPVELPHAVLLPCPLLRRHESTDPTLWLRSIAGDLARFGDKPRIVLAHGTVLDFGLATDDEESEETVTNLLDLPALPEGELDYIALGDWHGAKQVGSKAWYSGTPELDRFTKGGEHNPGHILVVEAARGQVPRVEAVPTGGIRWHDHAFNFVDDHSLERLKEEVEGLIGNRANQDLLFLHLAGSLGIAALTRLEQSLESWSARLIRLKLEQGTTIAPTPAEVDELTRRAGDPLVCRVANRLVEMAAGADEAAAIARIALRELHAACNAR